MSPGVAARMLSGPSAKLWIGIVAAALVAVAVWAVWPSTKAAQNRDVASARAPQAVDSPNLTASGAESERASGTSETPEIGEERRQDEEG